MIYGQFFATGNTLAQSQNLFPNQYNAHLARESTKRFIELIPTFGLLRLFGFFVTCPTEVFKTSKMTEMFTRMSKLEQTKIHQPFRDRWAEWMTWSAVGNRGVPAAVFDPLPVLMLYAKLTKAPLFPTLKTLPMYVNVIGKAGELIFELVPSRLPWWMNKVLQVFGYSPLRVVDPLSVDVDEYCAHLTGISSRSNSVK
jgi:hypothetical protein